MAELCDLCGVPLGDGPCDECLMYREDLDDELFVDDLDELEEGEL